MRRSSVSPVSGGRCMCFPPLVLVFVLLLLCAGVLPLQPVAASSAQDCSEATLFNEKIASVLDLVPPNQAAYNEDMLSYLHSSCLHLKAGWWEYELCFGRWLRQFHVEKGVILAEYFLGLGPEAHIEDHLSKQMLQYADGEYSTAQKIKEGGLRRDPRGPTKFGCQRLLSSSLRSMYLELLHSRQRQMRQNGEMQAWDTLWEEEERIPKGISLTYSGGTKCDLTGTPRQVDVLAVCDVTGLIGLSIFHPAMLAMNITEVKPCLYQVILSGQAVCSAMGISAPKRKPQGAAGSEKVIEDTTSKSSSSSNTARGAKAPRDIRSQRRVPEKAAKEEPKSEAKSAGKSAKGTGTTTTSGTHSSGNTADTSTRIKPTVYKRKNEHTTPEPQQQQQGKGKTHGEFEEEEGDDVADADTQLHPPPMDADRQFPHHQHGGDDDDPIGFDTMIFTL